MAAFPKLAILLTHMLLTVQAENNMIGLCNPIGRMKFKKGIYFLTRNEESTKINHVYTSLQCYDYCLCIQGSQAFTFCLQKECYSKKNHCILSVKDSYFKATRKSVLYKRCISVKIFASGEKKFY